jgi:hypothetical protein
MALIVGLSLGLSLCLSGVSAQTESTNAEDGAPASDAPAAATVPPVPVGANLTPPNTGLPPGPPIISGPGSGRPGSSTVSMSPGTRTTGVANRGNGNGGGSGGGGSSTEPAPEPVTTCDDFPTWYDAQLALESSVDTAVISSLDPDGDAIACEEYMYPSS